MSEDIQKKIDELEYEYARTQKNKATNYHLGAFVRCDYFSY
jgi:ribosome-interacting GTPase 1